MTPIGASHTLSVSLCPLNDAYQGITHAFCISIPHHWLLPGHHTRFQHPYALSMTLAGASHAHFASLYPIIGFCRGIVHAFSISIPHHWLLSGYHARFQYLYAPSFAFAGASYTLSASLCPLNGAYRGITHTFGIPMPSQWCLPGHHAHFQHPYALSMVLAGASTIFTTLSYPLAGIFSNKY